MHVLLYLILQIFFSYSIRFVSGFWFVCFFTVLIFLHTVLLKDLNQKNNIEEYISTLYHNEPKFCDVCD